MRFVALSADEVEVVLVALDGLAVQLQARAEAFGHGRAHMQAARLFGLARSVRRTLCVGLVEAVAECGCAADLSIGRELE